MAAKKKTTPKKPPKASEMTPELSIDYSSAIKAIHAAKAAVISKFPTPMPGTKLVHVSGKKYIRYSPTGLTKQRATLAALDRAAAILHEAARGAKVLEQQ